MTIELFIGSGLIWALILLFCYAAHNMFVLFVKNIHAEIEHGLDCADILKIQGMIKSSLDEHKRKK